MQRIRTGNKKGYQLMITLFRRVDWIRTSDPLHPMQIRYRAAPPPEPCDKIFEIFYQPGIPFLNGWQM